MTDEFFDTSHENRELDLSNHRIGIGEEVNLTEKDPTLKSVMVGAGWDVNIFASDTLDADLSVFMLNAEGKTRVDEDFVFYNNPEAYDGAVRHMGDSRTGAGDGDDETIKINLQGVPFDVIQIVFVLSIYKGIEKEQKLDMIKNGFLRVVNADTDLELVRYELDQDTEHRDETSMLVASLNREGPKWHFAPVGEFRKGGLKAFAESYDLIIIDQ